MQTIRNIENRLITSLIQTSPQENINALLELNPDWKYLIETCEEHRVTQLVIEKLKTHHVEFIPSDVLADLKFYRNKITKLNFGRTTQLIKIIKLLQENDIPVIAYKGMALAALAYQDISLRQFGDIDLLIKKKDFFKVKDLLLQIGCKPAWQLNPQQENAVLKYYYEYPFNYGEHNTFIEVHWKFVEPFFPFEFDYDEIWKRTKIINLYGKSISTLSHEDHLIILCMHGSKHFWNRLSWVCDIAKLVENTEIDWETVIRRAKDSGSLRMLWLGLKCAQKILNIGLPTKISEIIDADQLVPKLSKRIINMIIGKEEEPLNWIEVAKLHLQMRERKSDQLKYLKRLLLTKFIDSFFLPMGRPQ